jgi:Recombination endonuclease VII
MAYKSVESQRSYNREYYRQNKAKMKASAAKWGRANPDKVRQAKRRCEVKAKYGLSLEAYSVILAKGCCICGSEATDLDHDHATGHVRGGLCHKHNKGLGLFNDNPELLRKAADYLEKHRTIHFPDSGV